MEEEPRRFPDADPALAYDIAKHQLNIQLTSVDALDNKLAVGLSLGTGLLAIFLSFLGLTTSLEDASDGLSAPSVVLLILTCAAYLLSAYFFLQAFLVRSWSTGPATRAVWEESERYRDYMSLLSWAVVESLDRSYEENASQYNEKSRRVAWGFALLGMQVVLGAALVIQTF